MPLIAANCLSYEAINTILMLSYATYCCKLFKLWSY